MHSRKAHHTTTSQFRKKAKIAIHDGPNFEGYFFGSPKNVTGEVVFNTGMVGYPETLTDPSYRGQILVLTYPLVGNYGIPPATRDEDGLHHFFESDDIHIRGLVVSDYSLKHSHWNAEKSLHEWLSEHGIPGIFGVDTRALVTSIRSKGARSGAIYAHNTSPPAFEDMSAVNVVAQVSIQEKRVYKRGKKTVLLVDCGVKNNIIREFLRRDVTVVRVPWDYDFGNEKYDGLFISNGPGDPKTCTATITHIRKALTRNKPIFGICLGNQLLALAAGANTYKLPFGHRGQNQPCLLVGSKRCVITSQNHGYAVQEHSLPEKWRSWFVNANDNTNEGIRHTQKPFFSIQFHPEAAPGPEDTSYLFDEFISQL